MKKIEFLKKCQNHWTLLCRLWVSHEEGVSALRGLKLCMAQPVPVGTVHAARLWVSHEEGVSALGELELCRHNPYL
jgi:hypothetical protein